MTQNNPQGGGSRNIFLNLIDRIPILQPLKKRNFRLLWIGEGISLMGSQFHFIALSWLTLQITGSGLALGTVLMIGAIPRALLMLFGGALSDRVSPRRIMIASNIARGILVAIIAVLVYAEAVELWHLFTLSAAFGIADSFFHPALNTMIPKVVGKNHLEAGNAILRGTHEMTFLIGSAPAGLLIASVGMHVAFGIDALSFGLATIALMMMVDTHLKASLALDDERHMSKKPLKLDNIIADVKEGLSYVWKKPAFKAMIIAIAMIDFAFAGPFDVGLAWLADNKFEGGAAAFGTILSSFGGGALVGTIIAGTVKFRRRGIILSLTVIGSAIGLALFGFVPNVFSACVLSVLMGVIVGILNIVCMAWMQSEAPSHMMGRVMSLVMFASVGLMPISFAIAGALVDVHATLMFTVAGVLCASAGIYMLRTKAVREIN